jgi:hypothetical protein
MAKRRNRAFEHYWVVIKGVNGQFYKQYHFTADDPKFPKTIPFNGVTYTLNKIEVCNLNGWYAWLKETRNPFRQVYNMIYRWWVPAAIMVLDEGVVTDG